MRVSGYIGRLLVLAALFVLTGSESALAQTTYSFHTIPLPDATASRAYHINNAGQIAGRIDGEDGVSRGYVYDKNGTVELFDGPDGLSPFSEVWAINSVGQSALYVSNADFSQFDAFRREPDGSFASVNYLAAPGPSNFAVDINVNGEVLVQGDGLTFVHYPDGAQQTFRVDGYATNAGWGMNDAGVAVGVAWPGFFDTPNGLIYDINDDSFEIWNYPMAAETSLHDINNEGVIVGTTTLQFGQPAQSFIRQANGDLQFIEFPGALSTRLWGVNDAGVVSGRYIDADDLSHAFYAVPVPEPSSALLAAIGLLAVTSVFRTMKR